MSSSLLEQNRFNVVKEESEIFGINQDNDELQDNHSSSSSHDFFSDSQDEGSSDSSSFESEITTESEGEDESSTSSVSCQSEKGVSSSSWGTMESHNTSAFRNRGKRFGIQNDEDECFIHDETKKTQRETNSPKRKNRLSPHGMIQYLERLQVRSIIASFIVNNNRSSGSWQRMVSKKSTVFLMMCILIWLFVQIKTMKKLSPYNLALGTDWNTYNITKLREIRLAESMKALGTAALGPSTRNQYRKKRSGKAKVEPLPPGCISHSWQNHSYPNCNEIHEIDLLDSLNMRRFGPKLSHMTQPDEFVVTTATATDEQKQNAEQTGYVGEGLWRQVWKVDPHFEMKTKKSKMGNYHHHHSPAVLKMMKSQHPVDPRNFDRHRRDALVMERLTESKHVVSVYGYCGNTVLTEYAGRSLDDFLFHPTTEELELEYYNRSTELGRLRLALDAARSVQALHEVPGGPIIHADIQAKQFLFDPTKGLLLNDFNRCRFLPRNQKTGGVCKIKIPQAPGKNRAPEEYNQMKLNEKLDIFSLGHILHILLTGEGPWNDMDKETFVKRLLKGNAIVIPERFMKPGTVDHEFAKLILKCYEMKPNERISARELADEIEKIIHQEENRDNGKKEVSTHSSSLRH